MDAKISGQNTTSKMACWKACSNKVSGRLKSAEQAIKEIIMLDEGIINQLRMHAHMPTAWETQNVSWICEHGHCCPELNVVVGLP